MTREEEKIQASKEYAKKHPYIYYSDLEDGDYDDADAVYDFKAPAIIFAKGIDWADSHPVNQWRKAEDELPSRIKETVNISKGVLVTNGLSYGTGYYNYNLNKWFCVGTTNITHWMELPELPKEG